MNTTNPPGFHQQCAELDIPVHLLTKLLVLLRDQWLELHPPLTEGRPRVAFEALLFGTLIYLRDITTFRRAAARAGMSSTTLNDYFRPMVGLIGSIGLCQPDGQLLQPDELLPLLREMKERGEIVLMDGTFTRCPRPKKWHDQALFYDYKHREHALDTITLTDATGGLIGIHGGWLSKVSESEQAKHSYFADALIKSDIMVVILAWVPGCQGQVTDNGSTWATQNTAARGCGDHVGQG